MFSFKQLVLTCIIPVAVSLLTNVAQDVVDTPANTQVQQVQIEALQESLHELRRVKEDVTDIKLEQARSEGRNQVLNNNLSNVEAQVQNLKGDVDNLDQKVDDIDKRVTTIESNENKDG